MNIEIKEDSVVITDGPNIIEINFEELGQINGLIAREVLARKTQQPVPA